MDDIAIMQSSNPINRDYAHLMRKLILISAEERPKNEVFGRDISLNHYRQYLGTTRHAPLFYDASNGLKPNAFTALAGTLADNQNLYLYLPEHYPLGDPDHQRLLDYGENISQCQDNYNKRLRQLINKQNNHLKKTTTRSTVISFTHPTPQLILGARGRGKTTQLNHKIQWLTHHHHTPILLITPYRHNQQQFHNLPETLINLPPDEALRIQPSAAHLIIDEAAALPPAQLLALTQHYPAYTLATTTDGYEGSANTFLTKTLNQLALNKENIITLTDAHRYTHADPLETLIKQLTLTQHYSYRTSPQTITLEHLNPQHLATHEQQLQQLWQLLSQAHYRTRPEDLKRLLDLPKQHLFIAKNHQEIIAACHILIETPLAKTLAQAIINGERRPRGRILMQQLLIHSQNLNYASQPLARIQRIATAPAYRRQHLASQLLQYARTQLKLPLGTIHSSDPDINQFWQSQDFRAYYQSKQTRSRHLGNTIIRLNV